MKDIIIHFIPNDWYLQVCCYLILASIEEILASSYCNMFIFILSKEAIIFPRLIHWEEYCKQLVVLGTQDGLPRKLSESTSFTFTVTSFIYSPGLFSPMAT